MKNSLAENTFRKEFSDIYLTYYAKLTRFAKEYVVYDEDAENIVHDLFLFLWENRHILASVQNMNAYLFKLIRNRCIDFLRGKISEQNRNQKMQDTFEAELKLKLESLEFFEENALTDERIEELIHEAIDSLPEKCREIFRLSRFEGLKYKEIAETLNISVSTVETQMGIALRRLRVKLKNYLPIFFFFFI